MKEIRRKTCSFNFQGIAVERMKKLRALNGSIESIGLDHYVVRALRRKGIGKVLGSEQ